MSDIKITIGKGDIVDDYIQFINALNYKFKFENKDKFEDEFIELLSKLKKDSPSDADEVYEDFIHLIEKHSTEDFEDIAKSAGYELKSLGNSYGN